MYILDTITYEIKEATHNFSPGRFISYETEVEALIGAIADIHKELNYTHIQIDRLHWKESKINERIRNIKGAE